MNNRIMKQLEKGQYFGSHKQKLQFSEFIITDTVYTHAKVDWHYHENPYFTYLLQGKLFESNKKESYHLTQGSLLFHNWQDAHYNIKPPEPTRGFHIEMNAEWFDKYDLSSFDFEGSIHLESALIKEAMNKIFLESKINDDSSQLSIELLLLSIFNSMNARASTSNSQVPKWVETLKTIIAEEQEICSSLSSLAEHLSIHPVHLSREFPRYFKATLGEYLRKQRVNKAALLIVNSSASMTDISYECGFYDQSHFTSNFKRIFGITPLKFRKQSRC